MANKRTREETSEQIHTRHKKVKLGDNGDAQRVDPQRFSFENMNDNDPFKMGLPDDNDMDNKMSTNSRSPSNEPNMNDNDDTDFGLLLFQLASLDVDNNNNNNQNGNDNKPQTCPICSRRVSLKEFPDHVHGCLDAMDDGERNDMRTQCEKDSDFAAAYAIKHGYTTNYDFGPCPSCGKSLVFGMAMNEHVNKCLDEQIEREKEMKKNGGGMDNDYYDDDDDEDDDISGIDNKRKIKKVEPMSREQMIECANKLMTLQQGSEQFDNMLNMFGALGFNKANVKSVLKIEKEQNNNNNNKNHNDNNYLNVGPMFNNNNNRNNNNNNNDMNDNLSPIAEEDVDLFKTNNDNRNKNNNQSNQNFEQFTFDDDDL